MVGRPMSAGAPRSFTLNSNEVLDALAEPPTNIVSAVKLALECTPPELDSDIAERGIVLTGGDACLPIWTNCCPRKPACR
jgi:rod shape-determining protein MreB